MVFFTSVCLVYFPIEFLPFQITETSKVKHWEKWNRWVCKDFKKCRGITSEWNQMWGDNLTVDINNDIALKLYEKYNFKIIGENNTYYERKLSEINCE